tara:strand:- start:78 stop:497 length:420 start_codon:yes stop_codon:yes gene_type:complete
MKSILLMLPLLLTSFVQGGVYFYKSADREIPNDLIESFVELLKPKLSIFTSLETQCIDYYPISYNSDDETTVFKMDLRERHDSLCGGDPDTSPRISSVTFRRYVGEEKFNIYVSHWLCGSLSIDKYVLLPDGECSDLRD